MISRILFIAFISITNGQGVQTPCNSLNADLSYVAAVCQQFHMEAAAQSLISIAEASVCLPDINICSATCNYPNTNCEVLGLSVMGLPFSCVTDSANVRVCSPKSDTTKTPDTTRKGDATTKSPDATTSAPDTTKRNDVSTTIAPDTTTRDYTTTKTADTTNNKLPFYETPCELATVDTSCAGFFMDVQQALIASSVEAAVCLPDIHICSITCHSPSYTNCAELGGVITNGLLPFECITDSQNVPVCAPPHDTTKAPDTTRKGDATTKSPDATTSAPDTTKRNDVSTTSAPDKIYTSTKTPDYTTKAADTTKTTDTTKTADTTNARDTTRKSDSTTKEPDTTTIYDVSTTIAPDTTIKKDYTSTKTPADYTTKAADTTAITRADTTTIATTGTPDTTRTTTAADTTTGTRSTPNGDTTTKKGDDTSTTAPDTTTVTTSKVDDTTTTDTRTTTTATPETTGTTATDDGTTNTPYTRTTPNGDTTTKTPDRTEVIRDTTKASRTTDDYTTTETTKVTRNTPNKTSDTTKVTRGTANGDTSSTETADTTEKEDATTDISTTATCDDKPVLDWQDPCEPDPEVGCALIFDIDVTACVVTKTMTRAHLRNSIRKAMGAIISGLADNDVVCSEDEMYLLDIDVSGINNVVHASDLVSPQADNCPVVVDECGSEANDDPQFDVTISLALRCGDTTDDCNELQALAKRLYDFAEDGVLGLDFAKKFLSNTVDFDSVCDIGLGRVVVDDTITVTLKNEEGNIILLLEVDVQGSGAVSRAYLVTVMAVMAVCAFLF